MNVEAIASFLISSIWKIGSIGGILSLIWIIYTYFKSLPRIELDIYDKSKHNVVTGFGPSFWPSYAAYIEVPLKIIHTGSKTTICDIALKILNNPEVNFERVKRNKTATPIEFSNSFGKDSDTIPVEGPLNKKFLFQTIDWRNVPGELRAEIIVTYMSGRKRKESSTQFISMADPSIPET